MSKFFKKYGNYLLVALVIIIFYSIIFYFVSAKEKVVAEQGVKISELNKEKEGLENGSDLDKDPDVIGSVHNLTGFEMDRKLRDDRTANKILSDLLTWSDFKTYKETRDRAINEYKLDEKGEFLQTFMPLVEEMRVSSYKGEGTNKVSNMIDTTGANMKYLTSMSICTDIKDDVYKYNTMIDIEVVDKGSNTSTGHLVGSYEVNKDSDIIKDLELYYIDDF